MFSVFVWIQRYPPSKLTYINFSSSLVCCGGVEGCDVVKIELGVGLN